MNTKLDKPNRKLTRKKKWIIIFISFLVVSIFLITYLKYFKNNKEITTKTENKIISKDTIAVNVETFNQNKFNEGIEEKLLVEIGICDTLIDGYKLPCTPYFFKFFKLNRDKPLSDGFILLVNSRGFKDSNSIFTQRRLFVFERENGKLIQVNRYKANLVELRQTKFNGYFEMLLRFRDSKKTIFYCSFRWDKGKYEMYHCEEIAEQGDRAPRKVKSELKNSVSKEINEILVKEKLAF
jgi:hypothetical protein